MAAAVITRRRFTRAPSISVALNCGRYLELPGTTNVRSAYVRGSVRTAQAGIP